MDNLIENALALVFMTSLYGGAIAALFYFWPRLTKLPKISRARVAIRIFLWAFGCGVAGVAMMLFLSPKGASYVMVMVVIAAWVEVKRFIAAERIATAGKEGGAQATAQ